MCAVRWVLNLNHNGKDNRLMVYPLNFCESSDFSKTRKLTNGGTDLYRYPGCEVAQEESISLTVTRHAIY